MQCKRNHIVYGPRAATLIIESQIQRSSYAALCGERAALDDVD